MYGLGWWYKCGGDDNIKFYSSYDFYLKLDYQNKEDMMRITWPSSLIWGGDMSRSSYYSVVQYMYPQMIGYTGPPALHWR